MAPRGVTKRWKEWQGAVRSKTTGYCRRSALQEGLCFVGAAGGLGSIVRRPTAPLESPGLHELSADLLVW